MSKIYLYEVKDMIHALEKSGQSVTSDTHAIYCNRSTQFNQDLYPLEIIPIETMPEGTACIISKKIEESK